MITRVTYPYLSKKKTLILTKNRKLKWITKLHSIQQLLIMFLSHFYVYMFTWQSKQLTPLSKTRGFSEKPWIHLFMLHSNIIFIRKLSWYSLYAYTYYTTKVLCFMFSGPPKSQPYKIHTFFFAETHEWNKSLRCCSTGAGIFITKKCFFFVSTRKINNSFFKFWFNPEKSHMFFI